MMLVEHCEGSDELVWPDDAERVLSLRVVRDGVRWNDFLIAPAEQEYPLLTVQVKDDLAYVHYFPESGHPGFRSSGNPCALPDNGMTWFWMSGGGVEIINDAVQPWEAALLAAKEFVASRKMPTVIEWEEL